jgi:hypothetical protein
VNIKQDADHPLGRQVLGEHFGARPCVRQRRTRRCTADDWRFRRRLRAANTRRR